MPIGVDHGLTVEIAVLPLGLVDDGITDLPPFDLLQFGATGQFDQGTQRGVGDPQCLGQPVPAEQPRRQDRGGQAAKRHQHPGALHQPAGGLPTLSNTPAKKLAHH